MMSAGSLSQREMMQFKKEHESMVSNHITELNNAQGGVAQHLDTISVLERRLVEAVAEAEERTQSVNGRNINLEQELAQVKEVLVQEVESLRGQHESVVSSRSAQTAELESLKQRLIDLSNKARESEAVIEDLNARIAARDDELSRLRLSYTQDSEKSKGLLVSLEHENSQLKTNIANTNHEHQADLDHLLSALKNAENDYTASQEEYLNQVSSLNSALQDVRKQQAAQVESVALESQERRIQLETLSKQSQVHEAEKAVSEQEIATVHAELASLKKELQASLDRHQTTLTQHAAELERQKVEAAAHIGEISTVHEQLLLDKVDEIEQHKSLHNAELQDLEESHNAEIEYLRDRLVKAQEGLKQVKTTNDKLAADSQSLQADLAEFKRISEATNKRQTEVNSTEDRKEQVTGIESRDQSILMQSLREEVSALSSKKPDNNTEQRSAGSAQSKAQVKQPRIISYEGRQLGRSVDDEERFTSQTTHGLPVPGSPSSVNFSRRQTPTGRNQAEENFLHHRDQSVDASEPSYHDELARSVGSPGDHSPPRRRSNSSAAKVHALTGDSVAAASLSSSVVEPYTLIVPQTPTLPREPPKEKGLRGLLRRTSGKLRRTPSSASSLRSTSISSSKVDNSTPNSPRLPLPR